MAITIIRDLNDLNDPEAESNANPNATDSWRAALAECPNPYGTDRQRWCVAWGKCYAQLTSGIRPLGWSEENNTDEDGCEWFDSLEEAESYLAEIESATAI